MEQFEVGDMVKIKESTISELPMPPELRKVVDGTELEVVQVFKSPDGDDVAMCKGYIPGKTQPFGVAAPFEALEHVGGANPASELFDEMGLKTESPDAEGARRVAKFVDEQIEEYMATVKDLERRGVYPAPYLFRIDGELMFATHFSYEDALELAKKKFPDSVIESINKETPKIILPR